MRDVLAGLPPLAPPADAASVRTARGVLTLWLPTESVLVGVMDGHMTPEQSDFMIAFIERQRGAVPTLWCYHDWLDMTGYESRCRSDLTTYMLRNRSWLHMHLAAKHPLVVMGITVANLALGEHMKLLRKREELQAALAERQPRRA
jgi:hypothetical protein